MHPSQIASVDLAMLPFVFTNGLKLTATGIAPAFTGFPFNHFHEPNSSTNLDRIMGVGSFNYQRFVENYKRFNIFNLNKAHHYE
jgi:hypothetical protein